MDLSRVQGEARRLTHEAAKALGESARLVDQMSSEIRSISHLLHPPLLDELGLSSAIRWYVEGFADRSDIDVDLEMPWEIVRLPAELEIAIFRIVQESLTNVQRHSGSSRAKIRLTSAKSRITLEVQDYGKGIPAGELVVVSGSSKPWQKSGVGIQAMRERVRQVGGRFEIASGAVGTTVTASFPISVTASANMLN